MSIVERKKKTNLAGQRLSNELIKTRSKHIHVADAKHGKTCTTIGFGFTSDWMTKWP